MITHASRPEGPANCLFLCIYIYIYEQRYSERQGALKMKCNIMGMTSRLQPRRPQDSAKQNVRVTHSAGFSHGGHQMDDAIRSRRTQVGRARAIEFLGHVCVRRAGSWVQNIACVSRAFEN